MIVLIVLAAIGGFIAGLHAYKFYLRRLTKVTRTIRAIKDGRRIL